MGRFSRLGNDLYEGRRSIDFVGRKWTWYAVSAVFLIAAAAGLLGKGLNLGIEFEGGTDYTVSVPVGQATQANADKAGAAVAGLDIPEAANPTVTTSGDRALRIQTEVLTQSESDRVRATLAESVDVPASSISENNVGPSYGSQVTRQALIGLTVFLVLVVLFIWAYFRQWKMSLAALLALAHDVFITAGIYALSGFEVTPATVTGLLTILGFSLYDTVVVFDKIRENTKDLRSGRRTYAQAANLAVNQTLVRSINTSIVALLPVAAILVVGINTLGSGSLKDLALSLFVGMAAGTYSSIFIATPFLVQLKSGEKSVTDADRRAKARSKRDVDRYATVPVFDEGMPMEDEPGARRAPGGAAGRTRFADDDVEVDDTETVRTPRRPEATGSGRTVPEARGPLGDSAASGRRQPSRQPRSKRPKP